MTEKDKTNAITRVTAVLRIFSFVTIMLDLTFYSLTKTASTKFLRVRPLNHALLNRMYVCLAAKVLCS